MTDLIDQIPDFTLPLSEGDDLTVNFTYMTVIVDDDDNPVLLNGQLQYQETDYPDGASVQLEIDTHPIKSVFDADIDGKDALVHEAFTIADEIPAGTKWRSAVIFSDGMKKVTAHGLTTRDDGDK